jgi:hypothetical protein
MRLGSLWRNRWLRWGIFVVVLGAIAVGLYRVVPPEPRWTLALEPMGVFNAGERQFATFPLLDGKASGPLVLWDAATGCELARFLHGNESFQDRANSEDGRTFVAIAKGDRPGVWRIHNVDLQAHREWHADVKLGPFTSATFSPRCDFVALRQPVSDDEAYHVIVATATGRTVAEIPADTENLIFARDGSCVIAVYGDEDQKRRMCVVQNATGSTTLIDNAGFLGMSPDARWIIGDRGESGVWLWDRTTSRWQVQLAEGKSPTMYPPVDGTSLDFAILATRYYYGGTHVRNRRARDRASGYVVRGLALIGSKRLVYHFDYGENRDDGRKFAPDSKRILSVQSLEDGHTQWTLHDIDTGKPLWKRAWEHQPESPQFTPDSRRIVTMVTNAGHAELIDAATGESERSSPSPICKTLRHG